MLFGNDYYHHLDEDDNYILNGISYCTVPQPKTITDSPLFGIGVLLHVLTERKVTNLSFTQENITNLRCALYTVLLANDNIFDNDPKEHITIKFLKFFFPYLKDNGNSTSFNDEYINFYMSQPNNLDIESSESNSPDDSSEYKCSDDNSVTNYEGEIASESSEDINETPQNIMDVQDNERVYSDVIGESVNFIDNVFIEKFYKGEPSFADLNEVTRAIEEYQSISKIHLKVVKSIKERGHRVYRCKEHSECQFRVVTGIRFADKQIVFKNFNLRHTGKVLPPISKNQRKWKERKQGILNPSIEKVITFKDAKPLPKDVIKAAQTSEAINPSYNEAWRALEYKKRVEVLDDELSYQLLIPYLESFVKNNPESVVDYELDEDNSIKFFFICHGSMNAKLHHVRPVISIDATFMKEDTHKQWTLYMATVLSANNELVPVAFAITRENENIEGWKMFLRNLNKGCPIISVCHPKNNFRMYGYFTFISDRDKGIITAVRDELPRNHHMHCTVHIARNVIQRKLGIYAAKAVRIIAECYDKPKEQKQFEILLNKNKKAYNYLMAIEPNTWRSTSWMGSDGLPPRYGIYTTNASESANNMFADARKGSWLYTIDTMLDIMIKRNAEFQDKYKNYNDSDKVVKRIADHIKNLYNVTAGFEVILVDEDIGEFKVNRTQYKLSDKSISHSVIPSNQFCTCGKWQDREFPCIDAIAYFKNYERETLENILIKHVSPFYNCRSLYNLYKKNI